MIALLNELYDAINKKVIHEKLEKILDDLIIFAKEHFGTEEKYFSQFNYPDAKEHIKEHNKFKKKILDAKERCKNHEITLSFGLIDFLEDWLVKHLMTKDQKYKDFLMRMGYFNFFKLFIF